MQILRQEQPAAQTAHCSPVVQTLDALRAAEAHLYQQRTVMRRAGFVWSVARLTRNLNDVRADIARLESRA